MYHSVYRPDNLINIRKNFITVVESVSHCEAVREKMDLEMNICFH